MENYFDHVDFRWNKGEEKGVFVNGIDISSYWQGFIVFLDIKFKADFIDQMVKSLAEDSNNIPLKMLSHMNFFKLPETKIGIVLCNFIFACWMKMFSEKGRIEFTVSLKNDYLL